MVNKFTVVVSNKTYEVEVYEKGDNVFLVKIKDREYIIYLPEELLEIAEYPSEEVVTRLSRAIEEGTSRAQALPTKPAVEEIGLKVSSEIPGRLAKLMIKEGDIVEQGQTIAVIESMKMMIEIKSPYRGRVKKILVQEKSFIDIGQPIAILESI